MTRLTQQRTDYGILSREDGCDCPVTWEWVTVMYWQICWKCNWAAGREQLPNSYCYRLFCLVFAWCGEISRSRISPQGTQGMEPHPTQTAGARVWFLRMSKLRWARRNRLGSQAQAEVWCGESCCSDVTDWKFQRTGDVRRGGMEPGALSWQRLNRERAGGEQVKRPLNNHRQIVLGKCNVVVSAGG